eukprot:2548602-Pleurochrysis_carterae.AAC.1
MLHIKQQSSQAQCNSVYLRSASCAFCKLVTSKKTRFQATSSMCVQVQTLNGRAQCSRRPVLTRAKSSSNAQGCVNVRVCVHAR